MRLNKNRWKSIFKFRSKRNFFAACTSEQRRFCEIRWTEIDIPVFIFVAKLHKTKNKTLQQLQRSTCTKTPF